MNIENIVENIIYIPIKFRMPRSGESMYSLLKKSGYFEAYEQITEDMIYDALAYHPECTYAWLFYSEDQRTSSCWYFNKINRKGGFFNRNNQEKYIVGYFPPDENFKDTEYSDMRKACAAFIKLKIEVIRKI